MKFISEIWRERIIAYAPLFLWIGVIFFLSSSQGAMSNTSRFIRPFLEWLFPLAPEETLQIYHGYIRKFAHFFEYAMLAFFASRAFRHSGGNPNAGAAAEKRASSRSCFRLQKYWAVLALVLVVLVASIDEFNQSFNPLRTGTIYDVLLNFSGGLTMIFLLLTGKKWFAK